MKDRIRLVRKSLNNGKGMSQTEFASQIGMTRSMVSNLELGLVEIPSYKINSICNQFNVNEQWLRTGEGQMFNEPDPADLEYYQMQEIRESPALQTIVNVWMQLSPENKELAEKFVASFVADYNARQSAAQIPDNFKKNA